MKVTIVYEFRNSSEIDEIIENLNHLRENHITQEGCKEPYRCMYVYPLDSFIFRLEEAKKKLDNTEVEV